MNLNELILLEPDDIPYDTNVEMTVMDLANFNEIPNLGGEMNW